MGDFLGLDAEAAGAGEVQSGECRVQNVTAKNVAGQGSFFLALTG